MVSQRWDKIDSFDLLAVQGPLKSFLQHHNLKASILWHSAFFMVQLSQPDVIAGKTITLTIWTFVRRLMSLLFNTLSRFVPLLCLEGVPDLPVAPQDEAGLTKTFQTWPRGGFHLP